MQFQKRAETRGSVDRAAIVDGVLILEGWAFSAGRAIDSFEVSAGNQALRHVEVALNLPSNDVAQVFRGTPGHISEFNPGRGLPRASLAQVENCRFRIRVPVNSAAKEELLSSIIGVTPMVGKSPGQPSDQCRRASSTASAQGVHRLHRRWLPPGFGRHSGELYPVGRPQTRYGRVGRRMRGRSHGAFPGPLPERDRPL